MTMFYSFHENLDLNEVEGQFEFVPSAKQPLTNKGEIHLFAEKLRAPVFEKQILRPRLNELLAKSLGQFGATLVTGRAGTGKTALASDFARQYQKVSWHSIDSSESRWEIFSQYFVANLNKMGLAIKNPQKIIAGAEECLGEIAYFTESVIDKVSSVNKGNQCLIVLDDAHYLFDSDWFVAFFHSLIYSLQPNIHLLMLCRGKPSLPLWRLRSKQVLGVIDEEVLNFNVHEARQFLKTSGIPPEAAEELYRRSFGRISKLKQLAKNGKL
jgi:LuxR family maltose regulon positive regulatory protein